MRTPTRAALATLALAALSATSPPSAAAQSTVRDAGSTSELPTLPPMRAAPPAGRAATVEPEPAASPATPPPLSRLPRVEPVLEVVTEGMRADAGSPRERWEEIGPGILDRPVRLPVGDGHAGPTVLRVQVLLSRAFFSSGMVDGRWGRNTRNAVLWFQGREGLPTTGVVDDATYARLEALGGSEPTVREVTLTAEDVRGPFVRIPADIYEQAKLRCSCFESLPEKLSERHHARVELLRRLNPGVALDSLRAGDRLLVPHVREAGARAAGEIRQIVVSGAGNYLHALDGAGRILYHFPATLGSSYDPSPTGDFMVTSVHPDPWWHYQPRLLAHVPDDLPNAMIPPGPNNSVGTVWMALSVRHYGIHGTRSPETIGYAESAGCVRLTNWDVEFLSRRVTPGTQVAFRDMRPAAPAPVAGEPRVPARGPRLLGVRVDSVAAAPGGETPPPSEAPPP